MATFIVVCRRTRPLSIESEPHLLSLADASTTSSIVGSEYRGAQLKSVHYCSVENDLHIGGEAERNQMWCIRERRCYFWFLYGKMHGLTPCFFKAVMDQSAS